MARESQQYAPTFFTGFLKNSHKKDMMIKFHKDDAIHSSTYNRKKKKKGDGECTCLEGTSCTRELLELQVTTTKLTYI